MLKRIFPLLKSKSLGSVSSFLKIKNSTSHRALGDAETTAKILIKMAKHVKKNLGFEILSELINFQYTATSRTDGANLKNKFLSEFDSLPDAPGVYYFLDTKGKIIYIGKAKSIRERVRSYFSKDCSKKGQEDYKECIQVKN